VTLVGDDTEALLGLLAELRRDFPETGVVLPARLPRTEADCRELARAGSRVGLRKGGHGRAVGTSYVRCLKVLMQGDGRPVVATHDPLLIEIAGVLAERAGRRAGEFEYQLPYGVRPGEQLRLTGAGHTVRVQIPYGADRYGYLARLVRTQA
jgi:proline dehydrogenase